MNGTFLMVKPASNIPKKKGKKEGRVGRKERRKGKERR
jgi:hypothetical protein